MVNGYQERDTDLVNNTTVMDLFIMDIGETIWPMDKED